VQKKETVLENEPLSEVKHSTIAMPKVQKKDFVKAKVSARRARAMARRQAKRERREAVRNKKDDDTPDFVTYSPFDERFPSHLSSVLPVTKPAEPTAALTSRVLGPQPGLQVTARPAMTFSYTGPMIPQRSFGQIPECVARMNLPALSGRSSIFGSFQSPVNSMGSPAGSPFPRMSPVNQGNRSYTGPTVYTGASPTATMLYSFQSRTSANIGFPGINLNRPRT